MGNCKIVKNAIIKEGNFKYNICTEIPVSKTEMPRNNYFCKMIRVIKFK